MPRKPPASSPVRLKQKTLASFFSSPGQQASSSSPVKQARKSRRRVDTPEPESSSSNDSEVAGIRFEPEVIDLSEEDASPRRPKTKKAPRSQRTVGDDDDEDSSDSELNLRSKKKNMKSEPLENKPKKFGKRKQVIEESESEEEEEVQPKRRKLVKGVRPSSPEEDDVDILDEVEEHRIIEPRFRKRDKKSTYQKNLEKMKRKKKGLPELESSESSQSGAEVDDAEDDDDDLFVTPFAGAKPDTTDDGSHDDEELPDDSFIVEDDDGPAELPMEYSMNTHQDLAHHFKIICQLFVHIAVQPPDERHAYMKETMKKEEYFSVPLQIARRKLSGLRDSLVASSVWRPDFKNKLQRYPDFELTQLGFAVPHCDACHLGGRLSTLLGRVDGAPYDKFGFQPLKGQDSDSSADDSEDEERQSKKEFNLGRFCAKRTQVFHRFTHWEQAVFESLCREVDGLRARKKGEHGFVRVAFSKGKKPPEDLTDADGIMAWLDERGVIDMEWQSIKQLMESARNLEMGAKKGEDDVDVS